MDVTVKMDVGGLLKNSELRARNIAFAVVNAINDTALWFQDHMREGLRQRFTVRQPGIEKLAAVIKPFANVRASRPFAEVSVGQKRGLLLSTFERGGTKKSQIGANVAVPLTGQAARPGFSQPVTPNLRITALSFKFGLNSAQRKARRQIKGENAKATRAARKEFTKQLHGSSGKAWEGAQRTYLIPGRGIFQRSGGSGQGKAGGGSTSRMIYRFLASPQLKPTLHFVDLATGEGKAQLRKNLEQRVNDELRKKA